MQTAVGSISTLEGVSVAERVEIVVDGLDKTSRPDAAVWTGHFASSAAPDIEPGPYLLTLNDGRSCQIEIGQVGPFMDRFIIGLGELKMSGETT